MKHVLLFWLNMCALLIPLFKSSSSSLAFLVEPRKIPQMYKPDVGIKYKMGSHSISLSIQLFARQFYMFSQLVYLKRYHCI